jgi:hypothetical protein
MDFCAGLMHNAPVMIFQVFLQIGIGHAGHGHGMRYLGDSLIPVNYGNIKN